MASLRPIRTSRNPNPDYTHDSNTNELGNQPNLLFESFTNTKGDEVWIPDYRLGVGHNAEEIRFLSPKYATFGNNLLNATVHGMDHSQKELMTRAMNKFRYDSFLVRYVMSLSYALAHLPENVLEPLRKEFKSLTTAVYEFFYPSGRRNNQTSGLMVTTLMLATIVANSFIPTDQKTAKVLQNMTTPSSISKVPSQDMINVALLFIEFEAGIVIPRYINHTEGCGLFFTDKAKSNTSLKINKNTRLAASVQARVVAAATQVTGYGLEVGIVNFLYFANSITKNESDNKQNITCSSVDNVEVPMWDISKKGVSSALLTGKVMKVTMNSINARSHNPNRTLQLLWKYNYEIRDSHILAKCDRK